MSMILVGRDRELVAITAALDAATAGRGAVLLVSGEPGIGKTHLADAFSARAADRGACVVWGRAWEVGGAPAYWPWVEAFRMLFREPHATVRELPQGRLAELAQLDPELRERLGDVPQPSPLEPMQARFRLFDAAVAVLRHCASRRPIAIVLDDLHAADMATLELLQFVARGVRDAAIVIFASYRDAEVRARPELAQALARVSREATHLPLARLQCDHIAEWVGDRSSAELVFARTEGNPLFVVELLRLIDAGDGAALQAIPDGVRDVIRQRARMLPPSAREALEVAAITGRYVDLRIVAQAMSSSVQRLADDLAIASNAGILVPLDAERVAFSHVLIQEVLYADLTAHRRATLHAAVADALIERYDQRPSAPLAEIVHHLFAAVPLRDVATAIQWARRAAEAAVAQVAYEDAVSLLERTLRELPVEAANTTTRSEVLLELAAAMFGAGRTEDGRRLAREALVLIRRLGDPARFGWGVLTFASPAVYATVDAESIELLEEALVMLPTADSAVRARVLGRLGAARQPAPDFEPPMRLAREAIAMSRRLADPRVHLEVLHSATAALGYFADPNERILLNQELAAVATRVGDKARALRGHLRLVADYLEAGDPIQADACLEVCERLARQLGRPIFLWPIPLARAMRKVMQGQFAEAEALVEEARAITAQAEGTNHEISFTFHRLGALRAAARHDELAELASTAAATFHRVADLHYIRPCIAALHARIGAHEAARGAIETVRGQLPEHAGRLSTVFLAETAAALDDKELASSVGPLLEPIASRNHAWGLMTMVCEGPIARARGLAAATSGRYDEAEAHFEDALRRVDILGAPPHRARIELEYATMLLRRARPSDRDHAARLLDAAAAGATRLAMPGITTAIEQLGAPPPPSRPTAMTPVAPAFGLTAEGDFWTVSCEGEVFRIKDSRGLRILALLVASPDREFHVSDLSAPVGESGHTEDAGEALDARAVAAYKQRIIDLREELDEAERWADSGRASKVRAELEHLGSELARGLGLGGRARRSASNVERARVNVRKRLLDAITRLGESSPVLARHLDLAIKTGTFCAYFPAGRPRARP